MKRNSGNAALVIIVLVIIGVVVLYLARRNLSMNYQNAANPSTAPAQITSGNSNEDLQKDMNTIDGSFNNTNDAAASVNSGINDTPIAQPNY